MLGDMPKIWKYKESAMCALYTEYVFFDGYVKLYNWSKLDLYD